MGIGIEKLNVQVKFPLVQLPKKFKASVQVTITNTDKFPLVQLPKKFKESDFCDIARRPLVSISSTSEEVQRIDSIASFMRSDSFPLVQLPKKFKVHLRLVDTTVI